MTFKAKTITLIALCALAAGCAGGADTVGAPPPPAPAGNDSVAGPGLRSDVLRQIAVEESGSPAGVAPRLIAIRPLTRDGGTSIEQWTVQIGSDLIDYRVELNVTSPDHGDFTVTRIR